LGAAALVAGFAAAPAGTPSRQEIVLRGLRGSVCGLAWSPDGKRLVCASPNTAAFACVLEVASGRRVQSLEYGFAYSAAWSPDGKRIALGGISEFGAILYEAAPSRGFVLHDGSVGSFHYVRSVSWSPDGKRLAIGGFPGRAQVWDVVSQKSDWDKEHGSAWATVAWSPDGQRIALGDGVGSVLLLRASDGSLERQLQRGGGADRFQLFNPVAWSPDGRSVAAPGPQDGTVRIWDAASGREQRVLAVPLYLIGSLAWSPDGRRLAGHAGDTVWIWDVKTGRKQRATEGGTNLYAAAWSPDGRTLAVGCGDGSVRLIDVASAKG
jgi:WD40 repeat protein